MMINLYLIVAIVIAYLIGSIPTAVWYSKFLFGMDVRDHGSGNAGATNTLRVLGKKAGAIVMTIDVLKGFLATKIAYAIYHMDLIPSDKIELWMLILGFSAALGHIFPLYANFKGGKGVATLLGMIFAVNLLIAAICIGIFVIVLIISKYVSLGSMLAALAFPVALMFPKFNPGEPLAITFAFILAGIVVFTHQKNIKRLLNGEENKTILIKKKAR